MKPIRFIFIVLPLFLFSALSHAQHKIIWEATADTAQQRALFRQVNNVLEAAPDAKIELVFHSNAIYTMLKDTGFHKAELIALHKKGVVLAACNNSLKKRNITISRVMPEATIVPLAMLEIVKKQEEGWSYLKSGN
jgi:uncharacterized protein